MYSFVFQWCDVNVDAQSLSNRKKVLFFIIFVCSIIDHMIFSRVCLLKVLIYINSRL